MAMKEVKMPHLGESVTQAYVENFLVKPGDKVERYDPILEVVSDKVTTEVPSDYTGTIKEILIEANVEVPIGTVVLTMEVEGADDTAAAPTSETTIGEVKTDTAAAEVAPAAADKKASQSIPTSSTTTHENLGRLSPAVIRLAQEKGVDLALVEGTGKDGRITRKDILNFDPSKAKAASLVAESESKTSSTDIKGASPAPEAVKPAESAVTPNVPSTQSILSPVGEDEMIAADGVRKAIAKKMVQSVTEIPHAWTMIEVDVSNIVKLRNQYKNAFKQNEGFSLSYFPFFAKAVVQALKANPKMNTSWQDNGIVYHKHINLSIAVTTDEHLYVPVIKDADNYSIAGLAKEINRLATSVREGKLQGKDMQGGTFTLNNTGSIGSLMSMGIINHPQAAILQVETINKRFVPTEDGGFKVADMVNLCLSIDHRILDGFQAGNFLKSIRENLAGYTMDSNIY